MYSKDFRQLAVRLYNDYKSYRKVAKLLKISVSTVHRWKTKGIGFVKNKFRKSRVFTIISAFVFKYVIENPFTTQWIIAFEIFKKFKLKVSLKTISRTLKRLLFTKKKAYHYNVGRYNPPLETIQRLLQEFHDHPNTLHSIDECYFSEKVLAHYGWSQKGKPLHTKMQPKGWKKRSLLLMVKNDGTFEHIIMNGSINKDIFRDFITYFLPPNSKVFADNCSFHKSFKDERYSFIPPYSPTFNPVEYCFAKIKGKFRQLYTSGQKSFEDALSIAINSLEPSNIINSFNHVGRELESEIQRLSHPVAPPI